MSKIDNPMKIKSQLFKSPLFIPNAIRAEKLAEVIPFLEYVTSTISSEDKLLTESPIFIFSAGWRSGSTLMQRLLSSDKSTLLWGEPFGDRIPVPRLSSIIMQFHENDPTIPYSIENFKGELADEWIANLNPGITALRQAKQAFFETLFAKTADSKGYTRWGVKCVRLSAYFAYYIRWLYPKSKFIFLVRHPLDAYRSYKSKRWYTIRPDFQVNNILKFMVHWAYIADSFLNEFNKLETLIVRFEDLKKPEMIHRLSDFLEMEIITEILNKKVGSRKQKSKLYYWDYAVCNWLAGDICKQLGYQILPKQKILDIEFDKYQSSLIKLNKMS